MKILCIHGIGHQEERSNWRDDWKRSITDHVREWDAAVVLDIRQFAYDDLFAAASTTSVVYLAALARLLKSWVVHTGERDIFGLSDKTRWTVGMVAQWAALDRLRADLRLRLAAEVSAFAPDVILAHSLGTLVTYDTLSHVDSANKLGAFNGSLVTFGSQIAHPAVCDVFGGRVEMPKALIRWWNLFNENDLVFTREFEVPTLPGAPGFTEVRTPFFEPVPNHDPDDYLTHEQARDELWRPLVTGAGRAKSIAIATVAQTDEPAQIEPARPQLRALLVGIAEYANPEYRLQGPVNDVFLVSQTLQEMGVDADAIRVVLNERATAVAIRERLAWLLNDTRDGDTVFFYFSGHGAQVPAYGRDAEVDHIDECLVPYDFNWQQGNAIFDDEFAGLYSQLPYAAKFVAMLDCCHAGGMRRGVPGAAGASNGSGARGIAIPDDIRHRALRWDRNKQMWLPRDQLMKKGAKRKRMMQEAETGNAKADVSEQAKVEARLGEDGTLRRFGRGQALRGDDALAYNARRDAYDHKGPYMPILLEACMENQSAYEYQHGAVSYGAFTYALCESLNRGRKLDNAGKSSKPAKAGKGGSASKAATALTFDALVKLAAQRVKAVASGPQTPQLVCPEFRRTQSVI